MTRLATMRRTSLPREVALEPEQGPACCDANALA